MRHVWKIAAATVTVSGYTGVYDAAAHGATGSATSFYLPLGRVQRAVRLIQTTQNPEGGWRYQPQPYDAGSKSAVPHTSPFI